MCLLVNAPYLLCMTNGKHVFFFAHDFSQKAYKLLKGNFKMKKLSICFHLILLFLLIYTIIIKRCVVIHSVADDMVCTLSFKGYVYLCAVFSAKTLKLKSV